LVAAARRRSAVTTTENDAASRGQAVTSCRGKQRLQRLGCKLKISPCALYEMFLIKPPFFPRQLTALLNYGQINKKGSHEKAHRAKGKGDSQTIAEKIDSQEADDARNRSYKNCRIAWQIIGDKPSPAKTRPVHSQAKGETAAIARCHG
jgi:hypothetical protein